MAVLFKIVGLRSQSAHHQPLQRRASAPSGTGIGVDGNMQQLPAKLDSASTEIIIMAGSRSGRAGAVGKLSFLGFTARMLLQFILVATLWQSVVADSNNCK